MATPVLQPRVSASQYGALRTWLLANDPDGPKFLVWSQQQRGRPETSEKLAAEIIWIILCAGRSAQAARTLERKVWWAINSHTPVVTIFGYKAKAQAIERAWQERQQDFQALQSIPVPAVGALLEWCKSLPFIGEDTQYQLAKNLGADVCKPDIWLCRLAGLPDRPRQPLKLRFAHCLALCKTLANASGDSVATVDSLLWLACNKGVLRVSPDAGPVSLAFEAPPSSTSKPLNGARRRRALK